MRAETFHAPSMAAALRLVKAALGPDAVLLETAAGPAGVTIRAGAPPVRAATGEDAMEALGATLQAALGPAPRIELFVGLPGDGKTSTIAKVAVREHRAGRRLALVTADTHRVGGAAELAVVSRALGVPLVAADGPERLAAVLQTLGATARVLVDTAGAGPTQAAAIAELVALADAVAGPEARATLVLAATTASDVAARVCAAYAGLGPRRCVVTKADLAPCGPVVSQIWGHALAVSHVSYGRRVSDDLVEATASGMARRLLAA